MTLRDQPAALSAGDLAVLELLLDARSRGEAVPVAEVERVGSTRFLRSLVKRLASHGYVVGEMRGVCELVHVPGVERTDDRASFACASEGRITPQQVVGSLDAGRLFDLPSTPHFREAA